MLTTLLVLAPLVGLAHAAQAQPNSGKWIRFTAGRSAIELNGGISRLYLRFDDSNSDSLAYKRISANLLVDSVVSDGSISAVDSRSQLDSVNISSSTLLSVLEQHRIMTLERRLPKAVPADTLRWIPHKSAYVRLPDLSIYYTVRVPDSLQLSIGLSHFEAVQDIGEVGELGYAVLDAPDYFEPDDPKYPDQWPLHDTAGGMRVHATWHRDFKQGNVLVGVIDGGAQQDHEDLNGKIVGGETGVNPVNPSHGTRVTGIIGGVVDNGVGVASVAANSTFKVYNGSDGTNFIADMYDAMWSFPYALVLNLSWHWSSGNDPALAAVCQAAYNSDVILVASTGNDGQQQINYPAGYNAWVIAVGASDEQGDRLACSNYGTHIDFVAPGINLWSTEYYTFEGAGASTVPTKYFYATECATSWAAPHVTGLAALLKAYDASMSFENVVSKLVGAASQQQRDNYVGYGFVDAEALLEEYICPVEITGDVNVTGSISSSDVVYMVNYVFKSGPAPQPCAASGDVNCSGTVTSADVNYLVAFVFSGGPAPCNVCELINQGTWSCP